MGTIHEPRYIKLIEHLKQAREEKRLSEDSLAEKLHQPKAYVSSVEKCEQEIGIIELYDWLVALEQNPLLFFDSLGWFSHDKNGNSTLPALPIPEKVKPHFNGVLQQLVWKNQIVEVLLEGISVEDYLETEKFICTIFTKLNLPKPPFKNREAIFRALDYAINRLPNLNPSDIYQHLIYRFYLREYMRTQADRSWVRAGGEALELFVEHHYNPKLEPHGIKIKALISGEAKAKVLKEMGLEGQVGKSKLDVALYGRLKENYVLFGGIHIKASLAERVSDDVPCSEAMMKKGLISYLFTFDSKSFPPPHGNLVNRGELGTIEQPSDKRNYVEEHGSFDACFSYNLRTIPSNEKTLSGKRIFVSSFKEDEDLLPDRIVSAWYSFKKNL